MDTLVQSLGDRIREARLERKMTQDELAAGVFSKSYVSAVELGKIQPSIKALQILARRLNLPTAHFIETLEPDQDTQKVLFSFVQLKLLLRIALENRQKPEAEEVLNQLALLDQELLDEEQLAELPYMEAQALKVLGRYSEALSRLEKSTASWQELGEVEWAARVQCLMAEIYLEQNKYDQSQASYEGILKLVREGQVLDLKLRLGIYTGLARLYSKLDLHDKAQGLFAEASALTRITQSLNGLLELQKEISAKYIESREYSTAYRLTEQLNNLLEAAHLDKLGSQVQLIFGQIFTASHQWEEAEKCYEGALKNQTFAQHLRPGRLQALVGLGNLYLRQNRLEEAWQVASQACTLLQQIPDRIGTGAQSGDELPGLVALMGETGLLLAQLSEKRGDPAQADHHFNETIAQLKAAKGETLLLSSVYFSYGEVLLARGEAQSGAHYLKLAYEVRSRGNP
jgi:transcriptional regulator with XRE-family HTH domain